MQPSRGFRLRGGGQALGHSGGERDYVVLHLTLDFVYAGELESGVLAQSAGGLGRHLAGFQPALRSPPALLRATARTGFHRRKSAPFRGQCIGRSWVLLNCDESRLDSHSILPDEAGVLKGDLPVTLSTSGWHAIWSRPNVCTWSPSRSASGDEPRTVSRSTIMALSRSRGIGEPT